MLAMDRRAPGFFLQLALLAVYGSAQSPAPAVPSHYIGIQLPPGMRSEDFFVRYALTGVDFSSWVAPRTGVTSYVVATTRYGRLATGIKAVLHAPGCAMRTLDLPLSASENPRYAFICQPLGTIEMHGALDRTDRLRYHGAPPAGEVTLQARYVARWAQPFLGLDDTLATSFPVGDVAEFSADGKFRLVVPDLSQDPLAGAPDHPGEIQVWVKDKTGAAVAQLTPAGSQIAKTKFGDLPVQKGYPSEIEFAPWNAICSPVHDSEGFAIRPDPRYLCGR